MPAPSKPIITHHNGRTYSTIVIDGNVVETLMIEPEVVPELITRRVVPLRAIIDESIAALEARYAVAIEGPIDLEPHFGDHNN